MPGLLSMANAGPNTNGSQVCVHIRVYTGPWSRTYVSIRVPHTCLYGSMESHIRVYTGPTYVFIRVHGVAHTCSIRVHGRGPQHQPFSGLCPWTRIDTYVGLFMYVCEAALFWGTFFYGQRGPYSWQAMPRYIHAYKNVQV